MKSLKKSLVLLLSLSFLLAACSGDKTERNASESTNEEVKTEAVADNTPKNEPVKEATKTKRFENEFIQFEYPSTWVDAQIDNPLIIAAFVASKPENDFADNVNMVIEESTASAKAAADQTLSDLTSGAAGETIKDFKKISYTEASNGDYDAGILTGAYTQGQSGAEVILTQYYVSTGDLLYTMSLSFSKKTYDDGGKQLAKNIMDSLTISEYNTAALESADHGDYYTMGDLMVAIVPNLIEDEGIDERTYNYLNGLPELFPALSDEAVKLAAAQVDPDITSRHILKNINPYLDQMMEVSGYVVEIAEEEISPDLTIAEIHIVDEYDNSIDGIYAASTGDILEGDYVTMRGVPTNVFQFDNISGGTTIAILMSVSTLEKIE